MEYYITSNANKMIATPTPTKKKNAASRFRSRNGEKKESLKPLDNSDANGSHAPSSKSNTHSTYEYTTPIRNANNANNTPKTVPVTPESAFNEWADSASRDSSFSSKSRALSPALVDALQMAARPSPPHTSKTNDTSTTANGERSNTPLPTYTSSIEAMAAHVEASHLQNKWSKNRQSKSAKKLKTPTKMSPLSTKILNKNRLRTVSSSTSLSSSKSSSSQSGRSTPVTSNRKLLFPRKLYAHDMSNIPLKKLWLISLPILIPFILCELGIGLLVLLSKDNVVVSVREEGVVEVELPLPDVDKDLKRVPVYSYNTIPVEFVDAPSEESQDKKGKVDVSTAEEGVVSSAIADSSSATDEGHEDELYQNMLDEGFAKLHIASTSNQIQTDTERKIVESHCGNVWEVVNEMAIKEASSNGELSSSSSSSINWKALALDSQRCLAASGLSFLSIKDTLDISTRLVVSTKVFDRLSYVEPQDADIRGGLGTALLFQGIFHDDIEESRRLLSLATYHLKVASSLCSTSSRVGDMETAAADILTPVPSRLSEEVINQNSISHTAILHNLALAYLATGNMKGAVPILLQSAAMKREHPLLGAESIKPYWNVPNDVLQMVEERALLISARPQLKHGKKKRRIPFMGKFNTEMMLDIGVM